mmetsp:Transcript_31797/g.57552  ORF Transcript_31797/g.57552 Transcript_31797/m.57552 type:complete len:148 (-) Transcript_31797:546-989(-)
MIRDPKDEAWHFTVMRLTSHRGDGSDSDTPSDERENCRIRLGILGRSHDAGISERLLLEEGPLDSCSVRHPALFTVSFISETFDASPEGRAATQEECGYVKKKLEKFSMQAIAVFLPEDAQFQRSPKESVYAGIVPLTSDLMANLRG